MEEQHQKATLDNIKCRNFEKERSYYSRRNERASTE